MTTEELRAFYRQLNALGWKFGHLIPADLPINAHACARCDGLTFGASAPTTKEAVLKLLSAIDTYERGKRCD